MMAAAASAQSSAQQGQAQQAGAQQGQGAMKLDQTFLKGAAVDNMFEIQLSQLAQSQAQDDKVKQLAQQMVTDHTAATEQLKQVAQKKQVQLPSDLPELKKEELQAFQSIQGSEFDQAYLSCMKVAHAKDVAAFQEKSKNAKDPEIKQFASTLLPKLQQHKQHVTQMTGGSDDAQTAGSRQGAGSSDSSSSGSSSSGTSGSSSSGSSGSSGGTSSSGSGSRENGSGTSTGSGTTGAGSSGRSSGSSSGQ